MANFKTMIFDFGNVVAYFDHRVACQRLTDYCSLDAKKIYDLLFSADRLNDRFERGELNPEEFLQELRGSLEIASSVGDSELKQAWNDIFRPNRDVMDRLTDFKQECRLILASNTNPLHIDFVITHPKFQKALSCFDLSVLSYKVGHRKPDPRFFSKCIEMVGSDPAECLYLDDLPENVTAARAAGLQSFQYVKSLEDSIGGV
ncbi:MAG TPA: HAD family phosphatase [Planctomycetaceae bacterium]|nr:HAD family phosphatase [Planctomycetaceae bacterium]